MWQGERGAAGAGDKGAWSSESPGDPPGSSPRTRWGQGEQRGLRRGHRLQHRSGRYGRGSIRRGCNLKRHFKD